ncbi:hypothetical protein CMK19_00455 [Candidatus Poribacteria bacterium]|nr:hypothetical protein [Candidatus Poribacteria bacterium]|tara:strand:- start:294 stop:647 length:354 start_codon:yes stop_codon:yes gene_type:complete
MRRLVEINSAMSTWTYNETNKTVEEFNLDNIKNALQNGDTVYRIHPEKVNLSGKKATITWANPYVIHKGKLRIDLAPFPSDSWKSDMETIIKNAREIYREQQASLLQQAEASPEATA